MIPPSSNRRRRRHVTIEFLEARIAPATLVTLNDTTHVLTVQGDYLDDGSNTVQAGAPETLSFAVSAGRLFIADSLHGVTAVGSSVSQAGPGAVSIPFTSLTGDYVIDTGTGADTLDFADTIALAANKNLAAHTTGTITFAPTAKLSASGGGALALTTGRNISIAAGAMLTVGDGNLNLTASGTVSGNYSGIFVGGSLVSVGSGSLILDGLGGNSGSNNHGIEVSGQLSTGTGSIVLQGRGGLGGIDANSGVAAAQGAVTTASGDITLRGTPGTDAGESLGIDLNLPLTTTNGGKVHFVTDKGLFFEQDAAVQAGTAAVSFEPLSSGTPISLGTFQRTAFGVTDAMLAVITAGQVVIGNGQAGAIAVDGAIDSQNSLTLKSGATVSGLADLGVAAGRSLFIEAAGTIQLQGTVSVAGLLSLTGVGGNVDMNLANAQNDFGIVHVIGGATVDLRDLDGFDFDAQATTLLSLNSVGLITQLGPITGGADLLKLGAGTLRLSLANAIGNTTIGAGDIVFSNAGALGVGTITLGSQAVGSVDVSLLASGPISTGAFLNPIVVPSILGGGVVKIGSTVTAAGGAGSNFEGSMLLNRPTTLQSGNAGGTFFRGPISGNVSTLTVAGGARVGLGGSDNTFVGNVQIVGTSTLELLPGGDAIPDDSNVSIESDSFLWLSKDLNDGETIGNLTGDGTVSTRPNLNTPQRLTVTTNGAAFQFDGFIKDGGAPFTLIKDGAGTATLTGELSYSGATVVQGGTLALSNPDFDNPIAQSSLIDLRAGATLDVTGLGGGGISQTLVLVPTQTLLGGGTINGSLAGTGKIAPGGVASPGVLTINGDFSPGGEVVFRVNSPYTTAGADFDQIVVNAGGIVDLGGMKLRLLGGDTAPPAGQMITLLAKNGAGTNLPGNSPVEGAIIGTGASAFAVHYNAGDGNDLVLTASPGQTSLTATLNKNTLTISDTAGRPHRLTYGVEGPNAIIRDGVEFFTAAPAGAQLLDNGHVLSIPAALLKGLVINGGGGDDSLTVDFDSSTRRLPASGFFFNGGLQTSSAGDQVILLGNNQGTATYSYLNQGGAEIVLSNFGKISLSGLESILNDGTPTDQTFNLPAGLNHATLSDDGLTGVGNGRSRLSGSTFPVTDFRSPVFHSAHTGVSINPGSSLDDLSLRLLPDFDTNLIIGSPLDPFDRVIFLNSLDFTRSLEIDANALTLPGDLHLSAPDGVVAVSGGSIDGTLGGGLDLIKTAGAVPGSTLFLNGANTHTGETVVAGGPLILANALAAQNSTVRILSSFGLQFQNSIGTYTVGGLAGAGALLLANESGAITLQAGSNDSTYAGTLSGAGTLHKVGDGTLTLTGTNTHAGTFLEAGILQIRSDLALGTLGAALTGDGGTLQAAATTTVARGIVLQSATTFQAAAGKTLTLSGIISGAGDLLIGDTGTVLVTGQLNTNTGGIELGGGASQIVNGVTISAPGIKGGIMITPGAMPNEVAKIDLTGVNVPVSLVIKNPKMGTVTVDKIISNDNTPIKMISLGTKVYLGDGAPDSTPDLVVNGKLTTLVTGDVKANTIIQLGKGLEYRDTYKNLPNVTLRDVLGAGVVIDVTGNGISGLLGGIGGGGLGKIVVNHWAVPGLIKTTQSITSFTVKNGNSNVSIEVDTGHVGALTSGNVGLVSIPAGQWAGASMQVEGVVAKFLTGGIAEGSTISAGAFGTINIKGNYAGSIIAKYDSSVGLALPNKPLKVTATGAIGSVTIVGDFTGVINGDGKVGNVMLSGTANFQGTLRGGSLGNISAVGFNGGLADDGVRRTITAIGSIGNITARSRGLTDYIIAAGTDLGSDALFGGVADSFHSFFLSTPTVKTAVSIGTITIKDVVKGTSIAAGVNPGLDGVYGDGNDVLVALPVDVTKTKVKIGAMTFDTVAIPTSALTFSENATTAVTNAFEAQVLTSVKFGKGASTPTNYRNVFTDPTYFDSGGSSTVVRLLM